MDSGPGASRRPGMTERWTREASLAPGGLVVSRFVANRRLRDGSLAHVCRLARAFGGCVLQRLPAAGAPVGSVDRRIGQRGRSAHRGRELPVRLRSRCRGASGAKLVENASEAVRREVLIVIV